MTNRKSSKLRKAYTKDLESCRNVNELVWIYTDFAQDIELTGDDLGILIADCRSKRAAFEKKGDRFTRATRPECRK